MRTVLNVLGALLTHVLLVQPALTWLVPYDPQAPVQAWVVPAIMATSALGSFLSNRKSARTSTQTQEQTLTPEASGMNEMLLNLVRKRLQAPTALPAGYEEGGVRNINSVFDTIKQSQTADLTARGLADSPMGATAAVGSENARGGEVARFLSGLPLVNRQLQNEDIGMGQQMFAMQPRTTTSTGVGAGSPLGSAFGDTATLMAFLYGSGVFGKKPGGAGPTGPTGPGLQSPGIFSGIKF